MRPNFWLRFVILTSILSIIIYGFATKKVVNTRADSPATLVVTKLADTDDGVCDADCSLREAIATSNSGDTITFTNGLTGTITLGGAELVIDHDLIIIGNGTSSTIISGNDMSRVFHTVNSNVTFEDLSVIHGHESLTFNPIFLADDANGGGLYIESTSNTLVKVISCIFDSNSLPEEDLQHTMIGSAVDINGGSFTASSSIFTNNTGGFSVVDNESYGLGSIFILDSVLVAHNTHTLETVFAGPQSIIVNTTITANTIENRVSFNDPEAYRANLVFDSDSSRFIT